MKKICKILSVTALAACTLAFVGCGDDSPNNIEFDENFEMVLSKATYSYRSKDSTMTITPAECKASTLGYVVWNKKAETGDTLKAYRNDDVVSVRPLRQYEWEKYDYSGKGFPKGLWQDRNTSGQSITNGRRFLKSGVMESVFRYEGRCFSESLLHQLLKKNTAIVAADSALVNFYMMFKPEKERVFNAKEMQEDLRSPSCNKITMYDGDVGITMKNFKNKSGTISLNFKKKTCNINFKLRHAYEKADCEAAFADFEDDKNASRTFDFYDYSEYVDYDIYCVKELVLAMQKDKKIMPRKVSADSEAAIADDASAAESAAADEIARSAVKFVLDAMK